MHNLWEKRRKPTPLKMDQLPDAGKITNLIYPLHIPFSVWSYLCCFKVAGSSKDNPAEGLKDQRPWSIVECAQIFSRSLKELKNKFEVTIILNPALFYIVLYQLYLLIQ